MRLRVRDHSHELATILIFFLANIYFAEYLIK